MGICFNGLFIYTNNGIKKKCELLERALERETKYRAGYGMALEMFF
jgi:hypothetical protein